MSHLSPATVRSLPIPRTRLRVQYRASTRGKLRDMVTNKSYAENGANLVTEFLGRGGIRVGSTNKPKTVLGRKQT